MFVYSVFAKANPSTQLKIVANTLDKDLVLSKQQLRYIYMGGAISRQYSAVNFPVSSPLRVNFNTRVVGLTESRIQAYWAQMRFTGRNKPPIEFDTPTEVVEYLLKEENAVAYLPSDLPIPEELTVLGLY